MTATVRMKASQIYKDWHVIDATGRPLGRVASEAAVLLRGKHKPTYEPHLDDGDFVIIINASGVKVTGRKDAQMRYYRHSGYPGGLKSRSYREQLARFPGRVIEQAVWGMLPSGPLGEAILRHLKVYAGPHHPHEAQITGSERARAARAAAPPAVFRPPRLRPLSVPQIAPAEPVVEAPPPPAPARRARRAAPAAEAITAPDAPAPAAPAAASPRRGARRIAAPPAAAPAPAATGPAPRRRAAKAEAPVAPPAAEAPARRRRAPQAEAPAAAPAPPAPPRTTRKKAAEPVAEAAPAPAAEPKKPARRRPAAAKED